MSGIGILVSTFQRVQSLAMLEEAVMDKMGTLASTFTKPYTKMGTLVPLVVSMVVAGWSHAMYITMAMEVVTIRLFNVINR
jgi:hypothetical protein